MKVSIKFVHRANMWCITYFTGKTQHQLWFSTEAEAIAESHKLQGSK